MIDSFFFFLNLERYFHSSVMNALFCEIELLFPEIGENEIPVYQKYRGEFFHKWPDRALNLSVEKKNLILAKQRYSINLVYKIFPKISKNVRSPSDLRSFVM